MEKVDVFRRLKKNKTAMVGLTLIALLIVLALIGPTLSHPIIPWLLSPSTD